MNVLLRSLPSLISYLIAYKICYSTCLSSDAFAGNFREGCYQEGCYQKITEGSVHAGGELQNTS